jgi:hypothetical protein
MNNPNIVERLIDQKLADLRAEGMRSQMLAQAGLQHHKTFVFPDLSRFFCQLRALLARFSLRRIERSGARTAAGELGCGNG